MFAEQKGFPGVNWYVWKRRLTVKKKRECMKEREEIAEGSIIPLSRLIERKLVTVDENRRI